MIVLTQITLEINTVLACCRSSLLLLSPRRKGIAGRHTFRLSIFVAAGVSWKKTHSINIP